MEQSGGVVNTKKSFDWRDLKLFDSKLLGLSSMSKTWKLSTGLHTSS